MSRKPENQFIDSVHKYLKGKIHYEKMYNPYRSGTPDVWYSGKKGDLWIEYKYLPRVPRSGIIHADLTPMQRDWCVKRQAEGRNVAIIVGQPKGGWVFRDLETAVVGFPESRQELANWILMQTFAS